MSCVGVASGAPCAGEKMLFAESIRMRASACASADSGRCTAIWSPSKSALNGVADERVDLDRLALDQQRLERLDAEAVQRRRAVQQHRVLADDLFEHVPDLGRSSVDHPLGALMFCAGLRSTSRFMTNGLNSSSAITFGRPHWWSFRYGPDDDDRAARVVDALAEQVLAETALLALEHVARATSAGGCRAR